MKRIIVDGANGYVASHFIGELLAQNYEVIALVRGNKKCSAYDRMNSALSEVNNNEDTIPENLKIFNYSLLSEDFGMTKKQLKEIFDGSADYFHFAASLKYDFKSREEIFRTNIDGVENSLRVFSKYATQYSRFFFISTAYSCGTNPALFKEIFYNNEDISRFRNYYEQSKRFAENVVKKYMEAHAIDGHILRLSQVVGNNHTGITKTDYGIFDFAKRIYNLSSRYPERTVRVCFDPDSTQNLIPIDTVTHYLMKIVENPAVPVIMNFVGKNAIRNIHIINSLNELLPINIVPDKSLQKRDMDSFERIISIGMSFTSSYTGTNISFDTTNLNKVVGQTDNEVTEQSVFSMLKYFISNLSSQKKGTVIKTAC